jgi:glycosyltransferase involved in cell wall biosynthesis
VKILFDAYWWHDGPPSGRRDVQELIGEWAARFPQDSLVALVRDGRPTQGMPGHVELVSTKLRPHALATTKLPRLARSRAVDCIISQNFAVKYPNSCVFVHDVLFQSNPEYFTMLERSYFGAIAKSLQNAKHLFTSSVTESERIKKFNPGVAMVHSVGLGIGTRLRTATPVQPTATQGLNAFVLTVGRINVRKNLNSVFRAVRTSGKVSPEFPLLVVGEADGKGHVIDPEVRIMIENGTIRFLGGVSDGELRWLYEHSSLLIFASLDEGFGLPPLEALHFGCPVALSDIPVFREIYGDAVNFFDPRDPVSIARSIDSSAGSQVGLSSRGILQTNSWDYLVARMRSVLERELLNAN